MISANPYLGRIVPEVDEKTIREMIVGTTELLVLKQGNKAKEKRYA